MLHGSNQQDIYFEVKLNLDINIILKGLLVW